MDTQLRNAKRAVLVTPSDTVDLTKPAHKGLYIGVSGAVRITTVGGSDVTFTAVPVGFFPVTAIRVWATGTTATNIIALS